MACELSMVALPGSTDWRLWYLGMLSYWAQLSKTATTSHPITRLVLGILSLKIQPSRNSQETGPFDVPEHRDILLQLRSPLNKVITHTHPLLHNMSPATSGDMKQNEQISQTTHNLTRESTPSALLAGSCCGQGTTGDTNQSDLDYHAVSKFWECMF